LTALETGTFVLTMFLFQLGECWVKSLAADIVGVIDQLDGPQIQLLLPHVRHLLEEGNTCVQAAWYLFDPMAQ